MRASHLSPASGRGEESLPRRLRFSSLVMAPAAGQAHRVNIQSFAEAGCKVGLDGNFEVLKSPLGDEAWCAQYCNDYAEKHVRAAQAVGELADPQVAHYLLRWACNASHMNYLARTTPKAHCTTVGQV